METTSHPLSFRMRSLAALLAIAFALLLASCSHFQSAEPDPEPEVVQKKPPPKPIAPPPASPLYEWHGTDEYVSHIEVDVNAQKAVFYSGDEQVGWTTVASGLRKYPTPIGTFEVIEKVQNKNSNLYGKIFNKNGKLVKRNAKMGVHPVPAGGYFKGAPMPYFMRLTNDGIGLHAGPIPKPGNPASHGCIRMPKKLAPILYNHVALGTPVTITGDGPTYASYLAKQRRSAPRPKPVVAANDSETDGAASAASATAPEPETAGSRVADQPTTATVMTTTDQQTQETSAQLSAADAPPAAPAPETASVPAAPGFYGTAHPPSPAPGFTPMAPGLPAAPGYPPAYGVPATRIPYPVAPAASPAPAPPAATTATIPKSPDPGGPASDASGMPPAASSVTSSAPAQGMAGNPDPSSADAVPAAAPTATPSVPEIAPAPAPAESTPPPASAEASERREG